MIVLAALAGALVGAGLLAAGFRVGYMIGKHGIIAKGTVEITRKARPEPLVI
jgi:hypothetical protein